MGVYCYLSFIVYRDSKKVRNCSATALVFAIRVEFLVVSKYSNIGVSSEGSYLRCYVLHLGNYRNFE
jgi:hypothetical protein